MPRRSDVRTVAAVLLGLAFACAFAAGCNGEPTPREVQNARAFEALLTAVSLKNAKELDRDARVIDERHAEGQLSDASHAALQEVVAHARAGDWAAAEQRAYAFRAQFGDRGSYFR